MYTILVGYMIISVNQNELYQKGQGFDFLKTSLPELYDLMYVD